MYNRDGETALSTPCPVNTLCIKLQTDKGSTVLIEADLLYREKKVLTDDEIDFIWEATKPVEPPEAWTYVSWATLS